MNKTNLTKYYIILFVFFGTALLAMSKILERWEDFRFVNEAVHSSIEIIGAFAGLNIAYIAFLNWKEKFTWYFIGPAIGFLVMSILNIFHALASPGQGFVFLHSLAGLAGGIGFILIFIPTQILTKYTTRKNITLIILISIFIGIWGLLFQQTLPKMLDNHNFTELAKSINRVAGILYFMAGIRYARMYWINKDSHLLWFLSIAVIFGFSNITFEYSELWCTHWWYWHFLSLFADLIVMIFILKFYHEISAETERSEERFRTVASANWVWEADLSGHYTYCSEKVSDILGYSVEELMTRKCFDIVHKDDNERLKNCFKQIRKTKKAIVDFEKQDVHKKGKNVFMQSNIFPILDDNRHVIGFRGAGKDVTGRKVAEIKNRKYISEIEYINKKLEDYSYTISHDLKEPIRSIRSFSEFIKEDYSDKFDEEGNDYLTRIIKASTKMALMIDDLLILSRVGRKDIEFKKQSITELISDVNDVLWKKIEQFNVNIIQNNLPAITCQPLWMKLVFQNLISNSIKYRAHDKTDIYISYRELPTEHEFSVRDNGKGIEKDQHEKIFGLFRKAHQDRNIEGSGAGLAIVKSIIEQHNGKVWIDWSETGEGTTIKFTVNKSLNHTMEM